LAENFSENDFKGDLSNVATFNPPLFSLVNTFNCSKIKLFPIFFIFVAIKNGRTTKCFLSSFGALVGSGIRGPGWIKIRIRDKHPGSATLVKTSF
jgi:hypothetical protein